MWPSECSDDNIAVYIQKLEEEAQKLASTKGINYAPRSFRPVGTKVPLSDFSSLEDRAIIEKAFLRAGAHIVSLPENAKKNMRPLGYEIFGSFGFGAMTVTYRNCPNNCPLALWWGEPKLSETQTLGKWYPLFPRKVNNQEPQFFDFRVLYEG